MPKIIDHEQRRAEIAEAVLRVVARDGVNGVTIRMVANEAGWSTGVLHHYFTNKQALLVGGLRLAAQLTGQNMNRAMSKADPKEQLRLVIEAGIPLDEQRESMCRIFFFFWAEGLSDIVFIARNGILNSDYHGISTSMYKLLDNASLISTE